MDTLETKKQTHLLLNCANFKAFQELCRKKFTSVSAEVNKFIKKQLEEVQHD